MYEIFRKADLRFVLESRVFDSSLPISSALLLLKLCDIFLFMKFHFYDLNISIVCFSFSANIFMSVYIILS